MDKVSTVSTAPGTDGTAALALTPEQQLAQFEEQEMAISQEGLVFRPPLIEIVHKSQRFQDAVGTQFDILVCAVLHKQITRRYYAKGHDDKDKVPDCQSKDGVTGTDAEGVVHDCVACPLNVFGSGWNETGEATRGKACKEFRRQALVRPDAAFPERLSIPTSSITDHDLYFSGRITQKIKDLDRLVTMTLYPKAGPKGDYAMVKFQIGDPIPDVEKFRLAKLRSLVKATVANLDVTDEEAGRGGANVPTDGEPY